MRVGGILWARRPPKAGGGPMLKRLAAAKNISLHSEGF